MSFWIEGKYYLVLRRTFQVVICLYWGMTPRLPIIFVVTYIENYSRSTTIRSRLLILRLLNFVDYYSRSTTIRSRLLFEEIRYICFDVLFLDYFLFPCPESRNNIGLCQIYSHVHPGPQRYFLTTGCIWLFTPLDDIRRNARLVTKREEWHESSRPIWWKLVAIIHGVSTGRSVVTGTSCF